MNEYAIGEFAKAMRIFTSKIESSGGNDKCTLLLNRAKCAIELGMYALCLGLDVVAKAVVVVL